MKRASDTAPAGADDLLAEYQFDYSTAKPNRFAGQLEQGSRVVVLEPDIAEVFTTRESVNDVLRAQITKIPGRARG